MQEFLERCRVASELLKNKKKIIVFGHRDADGICASIIIKKAFPNKEIKIHIIRHGTSFSTIKELSEGYFPVFVDYGSSEIKNIEGIFKDFMILDHHPLIHNHPNMINPWEFGIDGTREISGAGVAYLVSLEANALNIKLAPIALIGAMGDKMHLSGFKGPNELIIKDTMSLGIVTDGSIEKEIISFPFTEKKYKPLEIAEMIDACASVNEPYIAIEMLMGNKESFLKVEQTYEDYKSKLNKQLNAIICNEEKIIEENSQHLAFFIYDQAIEPGFTGILAEELIERFSGKPVIILSDAPYGLKASGRATRPQIEDGVDLGKAMSLGATSAGGRGGGHDIAAGATIDHAEFDKFKSVVTLSLFYQLKNRLKMLLELEVKDKLAANSLTSSLAVDNEKYRSTESLAVQIDNKIYIMVLSNDIGTFKNTVDDLIVCLSSCTEIVNFSKRNL